MAMNDDPRNQRRMRQASITKSIQENKEKSERIRNTSDHIVKFDLMELKDKIKEIVHRKRKQLFSLRRQLYAEQNGKCVICEKDLDETELEQVGAFELDHIIPFSLGGGNEKSNMQLLCRGCNRKKRDMYSNEDLLKYYESVIENINNLQ
jgi:CRISPR/Cas system Type II protein with McrA/HNH and RuvC-like nuclease domain